MQNFSMNMDDDQVAVMFELVRLTLHLQEHILGHDKIFKCDDDDILSAILHMCEKICVINKSNLSSLVSENIKHSIVLLVCASLRTEIQTLQCVWKNAFTCIGRQVSTDITSHIVECYRDKRENGSASST